MYELSEPMSAFMSILFRLFFFFFKGQCSCCVLTLLISFFLHCEFVGRPSATNPIIPALLVVFLSLCSQVSCRDVEVYLQGKVPVWVGSCGAGAGFAGTSMVTAVLPVVIEKL